MRKVVTVGAALVIVSVLYAMSGPSAQLARPVPQPEPAASKPSQVEVTNFPAVQEVSGSVDVSNLPLNGDGNVRVAGAPAYRWTQVADQVPFTNANGHTFGPIDVAGWRLAHFLIASNASSMQATVQWGANGFFVDGGITPNTRSVVFTTEVAGPQAQLRVFPTGDTNITVWLYLSN